MNLVCLLYFWVDTFHIYSKSVSLFIFNRGGGSTQFVYLSKSTDEEVVMYSSKSITLQFLSESICL